MLASPSSAATGNASLGRHLIGDPIPHGTTLPSSFLTPYYTQFVNAENSVTATTGVATTIAVNGWRIKKSTRQLMIVTLIAITGTGKSASYLSAVADGAAASSVKSACSGASGVAPSLDEPVPNIPNSSYVRCHPGSNGTVVIAMATARANVFAILATTSTTLSQSALTAATRHQYGLLSKTGFRP